jgi:Phosphopantetheine attachment site
MSGDLYQRVLDIVRQVVGCGEFDPRDDFYDIGARSLAILQIAEQVTSRCGVAVSVTDAFDAVDVDSFARLVEARAVAAG